MKLDGNDLEIIKISLKTTLANAKDQEDSEQFIEDVERLLKDVQEEFDEYWRTYGWRH